MTYGGIGYPLLNTTMNRTNHEKIVRDQRSAGKYTSTVFSLILARSQVFGQTRFQWTNMSGSQPGDLYGSKELAVLERPWPGGTTQSLLKRMEWYASSAGQGYVRRRGNQIFVLEPQWMTVVLGSQESPDNPAWAADIERVGYIYGPPGGQIQWFFPQQIAHYAPIPDPDCSWLGQSWITPVMRELNADLAAIDHKNEFFRNAATPNLAIKFDAAQDIDRVRQFIELLEEEHAGIANAFKTMYLGGGADPVAVGLSFKDMDYALLQASAELRMASAAGVPPSWVGMSEGLKGSALNAGNFDSARRRFSDGTMVDLWGEAAASLEPLLTKPSPQATLWYDMRVPFMRQDAQDRANVQQAEATTMSTLIREGYEPNTVTEAVRNNDWSLLKHTGLTSIQLQPPGPGEPDPNLETPGADDPAADAAATSNPDGGSGDAPAPSTRQAAAARTVNATSNGHGRPGRIHAMAREDRHQRVEGRSWYRIHAKAQGSSGPTRMDVYDEIGFWGVTASEFISDLAQIDGPVDLHINSPGGEVFDAYAIFNALIAREGVNTYNDGLAASSAALLMMAGEERYGAELSQVMLHEAWSGTDGNAAALTAMAARLETVSQQMARVLAQTVGGTDAEWRAVMQAETWYTADQALDAGLLTGIIVSTRADKTQVDAAPVAATVRRAEGGRIAAGVRATPGPEITAPEPHAPSTAPAAAVLGNTSSEATAAEAAESADEDNNGWVFRGGTWQFDPDGDGEDDSKPGTDTDHDYWAPDGTQLRPIPVNPATGTGAVPMPANAATQLPNAASVDNSAWDAAKAWANGAKAEDKAAFYAGITAGRRSGEDPNTQAAYALPYRYTPDSPPNAEGVRQALSRLPQAQGLTNEAAAKSKLEGLMKDINPDYEAPANHAAGTVSGAASVQTPAVNGGQPVTPMSRGGSTMEWTIEGRRSRVEEIAGLLNSMAAQYPSSQFPADMQTEWESLLAEQRDHTMNLQAVASRARDMETAAALAGQRQAQMAAAGGFAGDAPRDGSAGAAQGAAPGASPAFGAPAFIRDRGNEIYDLAAIRQTVRSSDELGPAYRDNALRAIERAKFPGHDDTAAVQGRVAKLLARVPDKDGEIAQRILATGNPEYSRVFGLALRSGGPHMLNPRDQQILGALGTSTNAGADGGFAVPFELDPSVTLTSDGSINPLRDMADVRQITSKELDLVNTAGVTVSRGAENAVNTDNSPTLTQPTIKPQRVQGFIPFSVEIEGDWAGLQAEMMGLLADAKDQEEATGANGFVLGDGTAPHAGGLITTFGTAQQILTAGSAAFTVADVYAVKNAVGPRFRSRGQFLTDSAIYDLVRQFGTGTMANVWVDLGSGRPPQLIGYPARELSTMDTATTSGKKILVFGDFKTGFLIVDRVGMNMELVPQLFQQATAGTGVGMPTGQRGYYCWWRNNSMIRAAAALKMLVVR